MVDNGERILRTPAEKRTRHEEDAIEDHLVEWYHQVVGMPKYKEMKWKELQNKLYELRSSFPDLTQAQTIAESPQQRKTFVYLRGDYRQRGIAVQPATPAVLPALPESAEPARLRLALASDCEPYLAGVVWAGDRDHLRRSRLPGREAIASGVARLAGG